nr:maleylacetoacetate isomerase [Serratia proteamaculans]
MRLYSFFNSSASYRVRIALALKGVDYQSEGVNIRAGEQSTAGYLAMNPIGLVPALVNDRGQAVGQSLAIIDYLDRRYPQVPLLPKDEVNRARALEIAYAIACDIHPINNMRVLRYLSDELGISAVQKQAWYAHWVTEGMMAVEALLVRVDSGDFCIGNAPTLADCCLIPQWANALRMGCDLTAYPRCARVYQACSTLPAFIAAAPEQQRDAILA